MNPARNLGPSALLFRFNYLWVYLAASVLGVIAAYALFRGATNGAQSTYCKLCTRPKDRVFLNITVNSSLYLDLLRLDVQDPGLRRLCDGTNQI